MPTVIRPLLQLLRRLWSHQQTSDKILVIQPFPGIGDVIWFLPHMHAIANARGKLTLLTKPRSCADKLLAKDPHINQVIWIERNPGRHDGIRGFFTLIAELKSYRFKEAWLVHSSSRYAWALYLAGIPTTYGFGKGTQKALLSEKCFLSSSELKLHSIEKANRLLANAKIDFPEKQPNFSTAEQDIKTAIDNYELTDTNKPYVSLAIGSSSEFKQWGQKNYSILIKQLISNGIEKVFLIGGSAEETLTNNLCNDFNNQQCIAVINQAFPEVAALIKSTRFCVGNDTGILNIAAAVKIPTFGLFGVTTALSNSSYMIALTPDSISDNNSMADITVSQVIQAITNRMLLN